MPLHLGTSGYAYKEWRGIFYPDGLKDREMLPYYASRFGTVEINYTFRHHPSEKTLAKWREETPDRFAFGLKAHQRITHTLRLKDAGEAVAFFLDRAKLLGDRLGPVLFQCPPSLKFDRERAEAFLATLPKDVRCAMEFRHPSWQEARGLLAEHGVAWCTAETDQDSGGEPSFEPFGYLRLRKERYEDDELKAWAERIGPAVESGGDVWAYFKHEDKAAGPIFAERLGELLGLA